MTSVPVRYATLAYGESDPVYAQAAMLIVSLLAYAPEPAERVVVTDHPGRFDWLRDVVHIETVPTSQLALWTGPAPFSMRQKLEAAAASLLRADAPLVFLDADVVANKPLDDLAEGLRAGGRYMHKREFELGSNWRRGNLQLWRELEGRTFGAFEFDPKDAMWNSGVLALPAGDQVLLQEALRLYDSLAAAGIRHFATEQLVVGTVLERAGRLREARPWFTHYWGNKRAFTLEIDRRLASIRDRGLTPAAAAREYALDPIGLPAEVRPGKIAKMKRWFEKQP